MTKYANMQIYSWEFFFSFSKEFDTDIISTKN